MFTTVRSARDSVEEGHPVIDSGLLQFVALFKDILRVIAFWDSIQRPVVAALHAERNLPHTQLFQLLELFHRFIPQIGNSPGQINVLHLPCAATCRCPDLFPG